MNSTHSFSKHNVIPVFILNWNGIEDTIECMNSVLELDHNHYVIVLMDNGSENNEGDRLFQEFGMITHVEFIQFEKNLGFCNAHIEAYDIIKTEIADFNFIALLNNDTTVSDTWLKDLEELAEHSGAGIVASKMIQYDNRNKMDNAGHWMLNTGEIMPVGHNRPIEEYNIVKQNLGACGGGCLYRVSMIEDIGFFDPRFTTGYEDAEFGLRAVIAGYKSLFCPTAIVYHKMGNSITKIFNIEYSIMIHSSILYSYFKNVPTFLILITIPSFIVKYLAMAIINIAFRRRDYQTVMLKSLTNTWKSRNEIKVKREQQSKKKLRRAGILSLRGKMTFFLRFDIQRFWNLIVKKRKGSIDTYKSF